MTRKYNIPDDDIVFIQSQYRCSADKKLSLAYLHQLTELPVPILCDIVGTERLTEKQLPTISNNGAFRGGYHRNSIGNDHKNTIVKMHQQGMKAKDIADALNISTDTVRYWLKKSRVIK